MGLKNRYFTKEVIIANPAAGVHIMWRAPHACKVLAVRAIRTGGTGAVVNAQVNTDDLLTSDLSLTTTAWLGGTANLAAEAILRMAAGDTLKAEVVSAADSPTSVTIQVDLMTDADVR